MIGKAHCNAAVRGGVKDRAEKIRQFQEDKEYRVSQQNTCYYIYLIATGTIDRKVLKALHDKADLAKVLADDYRRGRNPYSS